MNKLLTTAMICVFASSTALAQPRYSLGNEPVTLTASDTDPCSYGVIVELAPETTVSVYPGASEELDATGELAEATQVWICETSNDGEMLGIVYATYQGEDCEVSSPVNEDTDYAGPCDSGWIMAEYVDMLAG